ncbi:MAG: gatB, partial [Chlamydiia bacterium]|nr:gatB [Chlamydiia bacterium]
EQNPDKNPLDVIESATFRFDPDLGETILMRRKEAADDYRYFPEPDLLPLIVTEQYIDEIRKALPELPLVKEKRYIYDLGLSLAQAFSLVSDKRIATYFEASLKECSNAKNLANWIIVEFPGRLKEKGLQLPDTLITPHHVARLVTMIDKELISGKIAKSVADDMVVEPGKDPELIVKENPNYQQITNRDTIIPIINEVIANNKQSVQDYLAGRDRAFAFLVGQVMKQTKGSASPAIVNDLLLEKIKEIKEQGD